MRDKDARYPLVVDISDPLKRGKLLFETMQSERNVFLITSLIAKEKKSTYNKFLLP
jgi:hypothetical protein